MDIRSTTAIPDVIQCVRLWMLMVWHLYDAKASAITMITQPVKAYVTQWVSNTVHPPMEYLRDLYLPLTHWGWVTHICVGNLTIIGSDNGLSPGRRQAIIWTNAGILLIGPWGTNFSEILIGINTFSFKKIHLNMSSAKWCPFCLGLNVLNLYSILALPSTSDDPIGHIYTTYCGLLMPYGDNRSGSTLAQIMAMLPDGTKPLPEVLNQCWVLNFCSIHQRAISQHMTKLILCIMSLKIFTFKITGPISQDPVS